MAGACDAMTVIAKSDHGTGLGAALWQRALAQVAAAMWRDEAGYTVVCFRSVAAYMMGLLSHSAAPGSELA